VSPSLISKTISLRRGELHEPPFSETFYKSGTRITRPSDVASRIRAICVSSLSAYSGVAVTRLYAVSIHN
jgi:hypothetical protein